MASNDGEHHDVIGVYLCVMKVFLKGERDLKIFLKNIEKC